MKSEVSIYNLDQKSFKKRLVIRLLLVFALNIFIIVWSYFNIDTESQNGYAIVFLAILGLIYYILNRKYKAQLEILKETYLELQTPFIRQYTIHNLCSEVHVRSIRAIKKDTFKGYPSLVLKTDEGDLLLINYLNIERLQVQLEKMTGLKTELVFFDRKKVILKGLLSFIPSLISFIVLAFKEHLPMMQAWSLGKCYLVLIINSIFFLYTFSDAKLEGGIPVSTSRKLIFLMLVVFVYQAYIEFTLVNI
jgi:hypothetical protein